MSKNLDILAEWLLGNKQSLGIVTGRVLSVDPIRIQYGSKVILDKRNLLLASALADGYVGEYEDDNGTTVETKEVTVKSDLNVGDLVMMIPDNNNKNWFVIDKVVKP